MTPPGAYCADADPVACAGALEEGAMTELWPFPQFYASGIPSLSPELWQMKRENTLLAGILYVADLGGGSFNMQLSFRHFL